MSERGALRLFDSFGDGWDHRFVFWSGGRDSTVVLHLALRAWKGDFRTVFIDTGIMLPETLEYIHEISELWNLDLVTLKPDVDFWEYVRIAGFPIVKSLWCRRVLKMEPVKRFFGLKENRGWKLQILGIRKRESWMRKRSPFYQKPLMRSNKFKFTYELNPILEWTTEQAKAYMRKHKIPENPCYKIYGTTGCYFCPFVRNKKHYLTLKNRHPELFQKIIDAEGDQRSKPGWAFPEYSIKTLISQKSLIEWRGRVKT